MSTKDSKTEQPCTLHSVSGSINVTDGARYSQKNIHISTDWATVDYYSIKDDGECFVITKHYLEIPANAKKINKSSHVCIEHSEVQNGRYFFDGEESNEDEVVIYYR